MTVRDRTTNLGMPDIHDEALTMAIAIVLDRIQRLPSDDRDDLFKLVKELEKARQIDDAETRDEECGSIVVAMREILEQAPIRVRSIELPPEPVDPPEGLKKWIDYVSQKIRTFRTAAGMTQGTLAEKAGLPQSHISRLEKGKHSPSRVTIEKIAAALGRPVSDFDPSA